MTSAIRMEHHDLVEWQSSHSILLNRRADTEAQRPQRTNAEEDEDFVAADAIFFSFFLCVLCASVVFFFSF